MNLFAALISLIPTPEGWWRWRRRVSFPALALVFMWPVLPVLPVPVTSLSLPSEHQNHARELVKKADLSQWDALVIMSGDGLLFEVLSLSQDRSINEGLEGF